MPNTCDTTGCAGGDAAKCDSEQCALGKLAPCKLYVSPISPWSQRTLISAVEAGVLKKDGNDWKCMAPNGSDFFEVVEVDLRNKPDWFTRDITPVGKVPVMTITHTNKQNQTKKQHTLVESEHISKFILRGTKWAGLCELCPLEEHQCGLINDLATECVSSMFGLMRNKADPEAIKKVDTVVSKINNILKGSHSECWNKGPWVLGQKFSWADIMWAPMLWRLSVLEKMTGWAVPKTPEFKRLNDWVDACIKHPSVVATSAPVDMLVTVYTQILQC